MGESYDVAVIGGGIMGSMAAWRLVERGLNVVLIDAFHPPHSNGSSHGDTRVTRTAYFEHPDYVPLLQSARKLWHSLEAASGRMLLVPTGGLYLGDPASELIRGSRNAAELHSLPHRVLSADDVRHAFPQVSIPEGFVGFFEDDCGVLFAEVSVATAIEAATENRRTNGKCMLLANTRVVSWKTQPTSLEIKTTAGELSVANLVICGGPWLGTLVADLGTPLRVTRQVVGWVAPKLASDYASPDFPICCYQSLSGRFTYTIPILPNQPDTHHHGFKVACHDLGLECDPNTVSRQVTPEDEASFLGPLSEFLPDAVGPVNSVSTCLYTNTPDGHFLVGQYRGDPRVTLAGGFSGHGFKFAPVIGDALADLVTSGKTSYPVEFLNPDRFLA